LARLEDKEDLGKQEKRELKKKVVAAKRTSKMYAREGETQGRKKLNRQIQGKERQKMGLEDRIEDLKENIVSLDKDLSKVSNQKGALEMSMDSTRKEVERLKTETMRIASQSVKKEDASAEAAEKVKNEVKILRLRKERLSNSLLVIESKYDAEELASDTFLDEEEQLKDYLGLLREENESLRTKLSMLKQTLEDLRRKKQLLEL